MTAFKPEAQTLLTVVQTVESARPAPIAHWRAGFCPTLLGLLVTIQPKCCCFLTYPADRTLPKKTSSTSEALMPSARSTAAIVYVSTNRNIQLHKCNCNLTRNGTNKNSHLIAWAPSLGAARLDRELYHYQYTSKPYCYSASFSFLLPKETADGSTGSRDNVDGGKRRRHFGKIENRKNKIKGRSDKEDL